MSAVVCERYLSISLIVEPRSNTHVSDISVSEMWKSLYYALFLPPSSKENIEGFLDPSWIL
jgi:hypothetical protein